MNKSIFRMAIGAGVVILGIGLSVVFFDALKTVAIGVAGPLLILVGLVMVAIARE